MGEGTVKVPAEYAEAFRDAVLVEIRQDAGRLASTVEEAQRWRFTESAQRAESRRKGLEVPPCRQFAFDDIEGSTRSIRDDLAVVRQVFGSEEGELEVHGDLEALSYALETMADKVLTPLLTSEINTSPVGENLEMVTRLTRGIEWAVRESARLNDLWRVERKAKVA